MRDLEGHNVDHAYSEMPDDSFFQFAIEKIDNNLFEGDTALAFLLEQIGRNELMKKILTERLIDHGMDWRNIIFFEKKKDSPALRALARIHISRNNSDYKKPQTEDEIKAEKQKLSAEADEFVELLKKEAGSVS